MFFFKPQAIWTDAFRSNLFRYVDMMPVLIQTPAADVQNNHGLGRHLYVTVGAQLDMAVRCIYENELVGNNDVERMRGHV